jgi:hypothetical protein
MKPCSVATVAISVELGYQNCNAHAAEKNALIVYLLNALCMELNTCKQISQMHFVVVCFRGILRC